MKFLIGLGIGIWIGYQLDKRKVEDRAFKEGRQSGYDKARKEYNWQEWAREEVKETLDGIIR